MNVAILGSGGREHALAWKLSQSKKLNNLYILPGNAGTESCGINVPIEVNDFESIKIFVLNNAISMIVVGPEDPLVNGIHDFFLNDAQIKHIPIIGPAKEGAKLEGSKAFSKQFMNRHNIPTARYASFTSETLEEGYRFLESLDAPYVLKADGLAAGKGVLILPNLTLAKEELKNMIVNEKFGIASTKVVIEEFLFGIELSVFVLTDGNSYKILPEAKDYKRIEDGDKGLNTGGMGAVSPVPFAGKEFLEKVEDRIIKPTIDGLRKDAIPYKGFLFIGLMNVKGNPYVIEYNVRMGDPETEVVIPRIKSDLLDLFEGVANQTLSGKIFETDPRTAVTVVMASGGYPEIYEKGKDVNGLDSISDSLVFHAGTTKKDNMIVTNGGRVLAVTSYGNSISEAREKSYESISKISFSKHHYRRDIGLDIIISSFQTL